MEVLVEMVASLSSTTSIFSGFCSGASGSWEPEASSASVAFSSPATGSSGERKTEDTNFATAKPNYEHNKKHSILFSVSSNEVLCVYNAKLEFCFY